MEEATATVQAEAMVAWIRGQVGEQVGLISPRRAGWQDLRVC